VANKFDLSELIKDVSKLDTARQQIQYLSLDLLDPDPENFYSLDGLEELAGSIEMLGLQQPLLVRPAKDGRYIVISGHRRRAAIMLIRDGGSDQFTDGVPCIVDMSAASAALQELKLIMANADTRKMSSADQNQQAARIEDLLRQLSDEGFTFPGRLRDWAAKLSGMSRTKLARLKVIREKLDKDLLEQYYNTGKLNESVAYELAQRPAAMQRRICEAYTTRRFNPGTLEHMPAYFVSEYEEAVQKLAKMSCPVKDGCPCTNQDRILEKRFDGSWTYKPCSQNHCCANCDEFTNCRSRCPMMDAKAKAERDKKREASREAKALENARKEADVQLVEHVWARFGEALRAAGMTDKELRDSLKTGERHYNEFEIYMAKDRIEALEDFSCTDVTGNESLPFYYSFKADDAEKLRRIADALDVSLDWLFCRESAARTNVSGSDTEAAWRTGDPPADGRYLCLVDLGLTTYSEQRCDYRGGEWSAYGRPIDDMFTVKAWWPLPPDRQIFAKEEDDDR